MKGVDRRIYEELRSIVEDLGGSMTFEREGHRYGAWIVRLGRKSACFESNGSGFPKLDRLYVPKVERPQHWRDYSTTLIPHAVGSFVELIYHGKTR